MSTRLFCRRIHVITRRAHFPMCRTRLFHMNTLANKNEYCCRKMNSSFFCRRIHLNNCRTHYFFMNTSTEFMNTSLRKINSAFFRVRSATLPWIHTSPFWAKKKVTFILVHLSRKTTPKSRRIHIPSSRIAPYFINSAHYKMNSVFLLCGIHFSQCRYQ